MDPLPLSAVCVQYILRYSGRQWHGRRAGRPHQRAAVVQVAQVEAHLMHATSGEFPAGSPSSSWGKKTQVIHPLNPRYPRRPSLPFTALDPTSPAREPFRASSISNAVACHAVAQGRRGICTRLASASSQQPFRKTRVALAIHQNFISPDRQEEKRPPKSPSPSSTSSPPASSCRYAKNIPGLHMWQICLPQQSRADKALLRPRREPA